MNTQPYDVPSQISAEEGEVQIDGPGGIVVSLTPEAAAETSERLLEGAMLAKGQQLAKHDERGG